MPVNESLGHTTLNAFSTGNDAVLRGTTVVFFHPSTIDLHHNQHRMRLGNPTGRLAHPLLPS